MVTLLVFSKNCYSETFAGYEIEENQLPTVLHSQKMCVFSFRLMSECGGIVIADEVQVGFGRVGDHWWAFQQYQSGMHNCRNLLKI